MSMSLSNKKTLPYARVLTLNCLANESKEKCTPWLNTKSTKNVETFTLVSLSNTGQRTSNAGQRTDGYSSAFYPVKREVYRIQLKFEVNGIVLRKARREKHVYVYIILQISLT